MRVKLDRFCDSCDVLAYFVLIPAQLYIFQLFSCMCLLLPWSHCSSVSDHIPKIELDQNEPIPGKISLAPTGALVVMMVYYIYISPAAAATFSDFHSVH